MASSAIVVRSSGQPLTGATPQSTGDSRLMTHAQSSEECAYDYQDKTDAQWYLVWCYERSCKDETKELRDALEKLARDAGGKFFCVKKAKVYSAWRTGVGRRAPHVLLTDWREIKPCMLAMSACRRNQPLLIAVLAAQQKLFQRVQAWSQTLCTPGDNPVVIRDVDDLLPLLAKVSPELGHTSCSTSCAAGQGPSNGGPGQGQEAAEVRSSPFAFASSVGALGLPPSVVGVVSSVCAAESAASVEKILRLAAMDQLYED